MPLLLWLTVLLTHCVAVHHWFKCLLILWSHHSFFKTFSLFYISSHLTIALISPKAPLTSLTLPVNSQKATFVWTAWLPFHHPHRPFLHLLPPQKKKSTLPATYLSFSIFSLKAIAYPRPSLPHPLLSLLLSCSPWRQSRGSQAEQPACSHVPLLQFCGCSSTLKPLCSRLTPPPLHTTLHAFLTHSTQHSLCDFLISCVF